MANLVFDVATKSEWDNAVSSAGAREALKKGELASPKGSKLIVDVLGDTIRLLSDLSTSSDVVVKRLATVDMGVAAGVEYAELVRFLNGGTTAYPVGTKEVLAYSIDIECRLVEQMLKIYGTEEVSKKDKQRAMECARNLIRKVAVDYRNLCVLMNPATGTPVLDQIVNGVDVMAKKPTDKNLYKIFDYVNTNKDDIVVKAQGGAELSTADIDAKKKPKDSIKNLKVKAKNLSQRISPDKTLGAQYRTVFGRLNTGDKVMITGTAVVAGLLTIAVVANGVFAVVNKNKQKEEEGVKNTFGGSGTETYTISPEDSTFMNPAGDFEIAETEPATDESGSEVTTEDTRDYDEPVGGQNDETGASNDFVIPWLEESSVEVETEEPTEETTTHYEEESFVNDAEDFEADETTESKTSAEDENDGPLPGLSD